MPEDGHRSFGPLDGSSSFPSSPRRRSERMILKGKRLRVVRKSISVPAPTSIRHDPWPSRCLPRTRGSRQRHRRFRFAREAFARQGPSPPGGCLHRQRSDDLAPTRAGHGTGRGTAPSSQAGVKASSRRPRRNLAGFCGIAPDPAGFPGVGGANGPPPLERGGAMALCGTAKGRRSNVSMRTANSSESPLRPESIDLGTKRFPTKTTAYRNAARKARAGYPCRRCGTPGISADPSSDGPAARGRTTALSCRCSPTR